MRTIFRYALIFSLVALWYSCAIQVPPGGGEQDVKGPLVIKTVPENFSTGFRGNEITITFDEYIQLKDVQSQLLISPPLKNFPVLKVRKKTLIVQFEDTLESDATYSFNFGNSIVDLNESNPIQNFRFVFSTGKVIDSMQISGSVINAQNENPEKGISVMLYREKKDSIMYLNRPYYFARTDESGNFTISNISKGEYFLAAVKDINGDYLYTPNEESIAYSDSLVATGREGIVLRLFQEEPELKLLRAYSELPGKTVFAFNAPADTIQFNWLSDTAALRLYSIDYSEKKDSLVIWYRNITADTLIAGFPQLKGQDTVIVRLLKSDTRPSARFKHKLNMSVLTSQSSLQDLNKALDVVFSHPIESADIQSIRLLEDSIQVSNDHFRFADTLQRVLRYSGPWKAGMDYNLLIPSGNFKDIFGLENDSTQKKFRTREEVDYASLSVQFHSENTKYPIVLQLLNDKELVVEEKYLEQNSPVLFNYLLAGMYRLKVIYDENHNRKWDTGKYLSGVQPEKIDYYPEKIMIRSNWDVDITWQLP